MKKILLLLMSLALIACGQHRHSSVNQSALSESSSGQTTIEAIGVSNDIKDVMKLAEVKTDVRKVESPKEINSEAESKGKTSPEQEEKESLASFYRMEDALLEQDPCKQKPGLLHNIDVEDFTLQTDLQKQLGRCSMVAFVNDACPLNVLDFLGNSFSDITRENILSRTLTTQPWMLDNFKNFLNFLPDDVLPLFGSVTAIIIHEDIKPSFFLGITGAIYLDPHYLWLSTLQKQSLKETVDFRQCLNQKTSSDVTRKINKPADIRRTVKFLPMTRYVKDGAYALSNQDGSREDLHVCHGLASVIFHELAHAVDKFPLDIILGVEKNMKPRDVAKSVNTDVLGYASNQVNNLYPLSNQVLGGLAGVLFQGKSASTETMNLTAEAVGQQLGISQANDLYNFSKTSEDVAMMFEEYMMKRLFDVDREIAFVTPLSDQIKSCGDLRFDYQKVNRIGDLIPRAEFVVAKILPDYYQDQVMNQAWALNESEFSWCYTPPPPPPKDGVYYEPLVMDQPLLDNELDCLNMFEKQFHYKVHQAEGL